MLSAVVFFRRNSPKQSGCPYRDSTFIRQFTVRLSFDFDVARIYFFVPLDGSRETYCWLLVVSRCSFLKRRKESEETFEYYCPQEML
jgi:hypothetical protein